MTSSVHTPADTAAPQLTPRERAALTAAAMGYTQPTAARRYHIGPRVLGRYLSEAAARLGAANTTHAVVLALLGGHLDPVQIRTRVLPGWPTDIAPEERLAALRARLEQARLGLTRQTAQRYAERYERWRLEAITRGQVDARGGGV